MHSIELVFNNKRNIPSTPPPSTPPPSTPPLSTHLPSTHPPSTHPPSTHPQCPSKTKSKALLSIVRRIQNPQRHHQFFHHRRHPLCRCSSDPENPESNSNKRKWIGSSYIWNHGYVSWSRRSFQWVGTSLLMYDLKQTITDRRNRLGTDSVEHITYKIDELGGGFVDWKKSTFWSMLEKSGDARVAFESELTNQELRNSICGWKLGCWLATTENFHY